MQDNNKQTIKKFSGAQRLAHWLFATAFFALLITGLALVIPSLSSLAAGGTSRWIHRIAAVGFMLAPIYYLLADGRGFRELLSDSFTYDADDRQWLAKAFQYYFGKAKGMPPQGRINAGEKIHHALIIITFFLVSISGLVLWLGTGSISAATFSLMIIIHFIAMMIMTILTVGHIYFTFVYDALGSMISGEVSKEYAEMKHPKWLEQLQKTGVKGGVAK